jgi:hypothetical protein
LRFFLPEIVRLKSFFLVWHFLPERKYSYCTDISPTGVLVWQ